MGEGLQRVRTRQARRALGQTYTPAALVDAMVRWVADQGGVTRVIDPGAGTGRFAFAAARRLPAAQIVAVEIDPVAALILRATARLLEMERRFQLVVSDFRSYVPPEIEGATAYLGNPPYVRHHGLSHADKEWLATEAKALGLRGWRRAALHIHFLLHIARIGKLGDLGAILTACQWLDVEYGELARALFVDHLGGRSLQVFDPTKTPFDDEATAAIACFQIGRPRSTISLRRIGGACSLGDLELGRRVSRDRLRAASRWTPFLDTRRPTAAKAARPLGDFFQVKRGIATGANHFFVSPRAELPRRFLRPVVSRAKELRAAGPRIEDAGALRCLVVLPREFDDLSLDELSLVQAYLQVGRDLGVRPTATRARSTRGVVGDRGRTTCADPGHLYVKAGALLRRECRRSRTSEHRPRPLPKGADVARTARPVGRAVQPSADASRRPHLRRWPGQVRAERVGSVGGYVAVTG